jgi:hypothetical protein
MSVNAERPHLLVLPEDDANRQLANGFITYPDVYTNVIKVLPIAGGWTRTRDIFIKDHVSNMRVKPKRRFVLLLDFDNKEEYRTRDVWTCIPGDLQDRTYLIGVASNPEDFKKKAKKTLEQIGRTLAEECHRGELD